MGLASAVHSITRGVICCDCLTAVDVANGFLLQLRSKVTPSLPLEHLDLWSWFLEGITGCDVERLHFRWIKGHTVHLGESVKALQGWMRGTIAGLIVPLAPFVNGSLVCRHFIRWCVDTCSAGACHVWFMISKCKSPFFCQSLQRWATWTCPCCYSSRWGYTHDPLWRLYRGFRSKACWICKEII